MIEQIAEYFKDITIGNRKDLFNALNFISPLIDGWGLCEPLSGRRILRFVTKKSRQEGYVDFAITKKSGGIRKISAPVKPLKEIQSAINILLQSIFTPSDSAMGFIAGRNVRDNALIHVGQICIFNTDIENFFPSITKVMIRKALQRELGGKLTSNDVINIICSLCTVPNNEGIEVLPQGAPSSPILSNIVLKSLDNEMTELARRAGYRYSRYADDMTFSHSKQIRRMNPFWESRILNIIERHGLKLNNSKTKTYVRGIRQEVTGVIVSDKLNVSRQYVKQLRVLLHLWEKYGYGQAQTIFSRDFCNGTNKNLCNVIDGKINYLEMIKGKEDSTYRRFKQRLKTLEWKHKQLTTNKTASV